jgi:hypothetical protein
MDWQQKLRRLDAKLANGELSMAEYRKLRDETLAEASSVGPAAQEAASSDLRWQAANPGGQPAPRVHIPASAAGEAPSGEMTQRVVTDDPTTAVPLLVETELVGDDGPTELTPAEDETQVISADTAAGTEETRTESVESPGRAEPVSRDHSFGPVVPPAMPMPAPPPSGPGRLAPAPGWSGPIQGQAVFAEARESKRTAVVTLIVAVVVLALIGTAVWWFAFRSNDDNTAKPAPTGPTGSSQQEFSLDRLPNPTDDPMSTSGVFTVDQATERKLIGPEEAELLSKGGTEKIYYRAVVADQVTYQLYAYATSNAQDLASSIVERGKQLGMSDLSVDGLPAEVTTTKSVAPRGAIYQATYGSDSVAVRIAVSQSTNVDEQKLTAALRHSVEVTTRSISPR